MGLQSRRQTDALALALLLAHNDTRKSAAIAVLTSWGSTTLVAGTKTITQAGITAASVVTLTKTAHVGAPGGAQYKIVPSAGQFIITAIDTSGATVAADLSSFNWLADTPLFHADQTPLAPSGDAEFPAATFLTVTAATAADLPTSIAMANNMRQVCNQMFADSVSHLVADATNPVTAALAVDLGTTITLLNAMKTAFNAHLTQAGIHINNDTINSVATANATDLPSSITLANALKAAINLHLGSAPTGESVALLNA